MDILHCPSETQSTRFIAGTILDFLPEYHYHAQVAEERELEAEFESYQLARNNYLLQEDLWEDVECNKYATIFSNFDLASFNVTPPYDPYDYEISPVKINRQVTLDNLGANVALFSNTFNTTVTRWCDQSYNIMHINQQPFGRAQPRKIRKLNSDTLFTNSFNNAAVALVDQVLQKKEADQRHCESDQEKFNRIALEQDMFDAAHLSGNKNASVYMTHHLPCQISYCDVCYCEFCCCPTFFEY